MIRLAIRCRPEQAETILAELVEIAPSGVEETAGPGYVEFAVYGPPGEVPELPEVEAATGEGLVEVVTSEVPDDWADRWRDFHRPVVVAGGRLVVRPSWADPSEVGSEVDVVIDPGRAFGTGSHATTRLCLAELLAMADAGEASGALVDWGTGSGVLAIVAARLGFSPVLGVDHELAAVGIAKENAVANGCPQIEFRRLNLREESPPVAPLAVANLTSPLLLELAKALTEADIELPGRLLMSGILDREVGAVADAFAAAGYECSSRSSEEGWSSLRLSLKQA